MGGDAADMKGLIRSHWTRRRVDSINPQSASHCVLYTDRIAAELDRKVTLAEILKPKFPVRLD